MKIKKAIAKVTGVREESICLDGETKIDDTWTEITYEVSLPSIVLLYAAEYMVGDSNTIHIINIRLQNITQ